MDEQLLRGQIEALEVELYEAELHNQPCQEIEEQLNILIDELESVQKNNSREIMNLIATNY